MLGNTSIRGDNLNDFIYNTQIPVIAQGFTQMAWIRIQVDTNAAASIFYCNVAVNDSQWLETALHTDGTTLKVTNQTTTGLGSSLNVGRWYHITHVFDGVSAHTLYLDGIPNASMTDASSFSSIDRWYLFNGANNGVPFAGFLNGNIKDFRLWNYRLTQAEIVAEMKSLAPVARSRFYYLPLESLNADQIVRDLNGLARLWTLGGSAVFTVEGGPPVPGVLRSGLVSSLGFNLGLMQRNYRFRNDDGSETTATWKENENTVATIGKNVNLRLRLQADATGTDPVSQGYKLQYRKTDSSTGTWHDLNN